MGKRYIGRDDLVCGWKRIYGHKPPKGLSRKTMELAIAYQRQVNEMGAQANIDLKALSSNHLSNQTSNIVKPGARLIREWHGETYVVDVLESGFLWKEQIYSSLSKVAKEMTGTQWSGPRFFGLKQRTR
ncbi:DUF2924 domain-containing protein [Emcibacteraceae bacterium]|nr:DUF2924 domain-containing protein [Emcibacteraceae bacterium]